LAAAGGLDNLYGGQRFGDGGRNIARGLRYLAGEGARMRRKADFLVSAGQSTLFNLYLLERRARGLSRTVLAGDILRKTTSGGLFECADPAVDQARLDAGEVEITGPIYGGKMMAPSEGTPSADLEAAILARTGVTQTALNALGRKVPGTRRPLQLTPTDLQIRAAPAVELASRAPGPHNPSLLSEGVCLSFGLPAGAYATQLTHEIQGPTDLETP
ncbi:MAG: tRNA pseudouridine(13) synthase TruD, partial [Myxococcales bacterium]|nr:tRNA pseudouridine(13) synthase TruD [Myxococcales bacterium]